MSDTSTSGPSRVSGPRRRAAARRGLLAPTVVAVLCWYFGADVWEAILFGGVITALGLVAFASGAAETATDSWLERDQRYRSGSRYDIKELSAGLRGRYGRVRLSAVWRVQRLAQRRLDAYDLRLSEPGDQPAIRALLGRRAYAVLAESPRRTPPLRSSLLHCLATLDTLGPGRVQRSQSRPRRRTRWLAPPHHRRNPRER